MATLSRSDVEHVAHLARLGLTDEELTLLEGQLNHILDQYAILAELPTDDIPPTAQTIELENILRDDVVRPSLTARGRPAPTRRRARATSSSSRRSSTSAERGPMTDLTRLHAHEMAALLRAGEVSSRELTAAHLDAAERGNPALNAWLTIDRDRALAEADAADARLAAARADGPAASTALRRCSGIPVALKDLVSVKGGQCTAGSRILEGYRAPYDAHITERLRDAGAVILGKTNMDEFAMGSSTEHSRLRPDRQPVGPRPRPGRQQRRLGGGRRGVPRAAVDRHRHRRLHPPAGGPVRHRRDQADVRPGQPLRDRGVRVARSTRSGRSPGTPATPRRCCTPSPAATTATPRPRRRRCRTTSCRSAGRATTRPPRRSRASASACRTSTSWPGMEPGVEARIREAVAALEAAGATVEEVSLPHTDYGLATYYIVAPAEASANLARYDGIRYGPRLGDGDVLANYLATRGRGFGAEVKRRIMLGTYALSAGYYDAYYLKAQKVRTLIKADFDALWAQGFDALVAPTSPTVAFRFGRPDGRPGLDVPLGRLHAAGEHGRPARDLASRAACPTACRSGCSSSGPPWSEARAVRTRRAATRRSRPTPTGGPARSRPDLAALRSTPTA